MKKIIAVLSIMACSIPSIAVTNYHTYTGLVTTSATATSSGTITSYNQYYFSSQLVNSTANLYVVSSGDVGSGLGGGESLVQVEYSTTGCGGSMTIFAEYDSHDLSDWTNNTDGVATGAMNLSQLCVKLFVSATYDDTYSYPVTADITPSSIYVQVTSVVGGNRAIWWIGSDGHRDRFEFEMYPWLLRKGKNYGLSVG